MFNPVLVLVVVLCIVNDVCSISIENEFIDCYKNFHNITNITNSKCKFMYELRLRKQKLIKVAQSFGTYNQCDHKTIIEIKGDSYGNSGNNMIQLTHVLMLSIYYNASVNLPEWMHKKILNHFNTNLLYSQFCIIKSLNELKNKTVTYSIPSVDIFDGYKLLKLPKYNNIGTHTKVPSFNQTTVLEVTKIFLKVYACLWSHPNPIIEYYSVSLIADHMNGNLNYTTAHKRSFEGGCSDHMYQNHKSTDLQLNEISYNKTGTVTVFPLKTHLFSSEIYL